MLEKSACCPSLFKLCRAAVFCTLLLLSFQVAQTRAAEKPHLLPVGEPLHHITLAAGLSSSVVYNVAQDRAGYFWIATRKGLNRYREGDLTIHLDADNTTLLPDARLTAIVQMPGGGLWFGTYGGLVSYDGGKFATFNRRQGLPDDRLSCLFAAAGDRLWVGSWMGLGRSTQGGFESLPTSTTSPEASGPLRAPLAALFQDRFGHLWLGFAAGGVWRYADQQFMPVPLSQKPSGLKVHTFYEDRRGDLWIGSIGQGLWRLDRRSQGWEAQALPAASVYVVQEDSQGRLWAGTSSGLFRRADEVWEPFSLGPGSAAAIPVLSVDGEQNVWVGTQNDGLWQCHGTTCSAVAELRGREVRAILQDRRKALWVATDAGLYRRDKGRWDAPLAAAVLPPCPLNRLFEDDQGSLWIGTENQGLLRFSETRFTHFHPAHHLPDVAIKAQLVSADSTLWLGTDAGLVAFDGEQFRLYGMDRGLPHPMVHALVPAGPRELWIGTGAGLARWRDGRISAVLADSVLPNPAVIALAAAPDGALWLGTGAGLVRYREGRTQVFTSAEGLPHDYVRSLAVDSDGRLWIATSGGLAAFEDGEFTRFTTAEGLATNLLYNLFFDRDGGLWIGTLGGGVMRYDGRQFRRLTTREGLLSNTVRHIVQDRDGHILLSTDKGLTRYHRDDIPPLPRTYPPFPLIAGALLVLLVLSVFLLRRKGLPASVFSGMLLGILLSQPAPLQAAPPAIANLQAVQRPGTLWIDISYDLEGDGAPRPVVVLEASDDGGLTYDVPVLSTAGEVGPVEPGSGRSILWDAGADAPELFTTPWQVRLRLLPSLAAADMVSIPAGSFTMGSTAGDPQERPVHQVYLKTFRLDRFETTNRSFMHFVQATGYRTLAELEGESTIYEDGGYRRVYGATWKAPKGPGSYLLKRLDHPVVQVAWADASAYCAWAGKRLPSEAEWEKAARGTDQRLYPWGAEAPDGGKSIYRANYGTDRCCHESAQDGFLNTAPVGSFPLGASPYGLYDMTGNVWEWVQDWYGPDYYAASPWRNPTGPAAGTERVLRGGSWISYRFMLRTSYRGHHTEETRHNYSGFRCARDE